MNFEPPEPMPPAPAPPPEVVTDLNYEQLMNEANTLAALDPTPDSPEGRRLDELATAIEAYEKVKFPLGCDVLWDDSQYPN